MRNIVKKTFFATMLGATLLSSLTGCKKDKEINEDVNLSEDTKLALTDEEVREYIKNHPDILDQETSEIEEDNVSSDLKVPSDTERKELARKSYEEYKELYNDLGANQEQVNIMVDFLYGFYNGYTEAEIQDAASLIENVLYPDNLHQILDNCNAIKLGYEFEMDHSDYFDSETDTFYVARYPKISEFFEGQEIPEINVVKEYEELVDDIVAEFIETGTCSDEMREKIKNKFLKQEEEEYDLSHSEMSQSINNEGIGYLEATVKKSYCSLASMSNCNLPFIEGKNGKKYQLNARSDVNEKGYIETEVLAEREQAEQTGRKLTEDKASKVAEIENKIVSTKYIRGQCTLVDQILTKAGYIKTSQKENLQKIKALLEQRIFYNEIELALNSQSKECKLTLHM